MRDNMKRNQGGRRSLIAWIIVVFAMAAALFIGIGMIRGIDQQIGRAHV